MSIRLRKNNVYANGRIIDFDDGEQLLLRSFNFSIDMFEEFDYHTVVDDETLSDIAFRKYRFKVKDPSKYWYVIADVNEIHDPLDISEYVGSSIVIPNILEVKRLIAQA